MLLRSVKFVLVFVGGLLHSEVLLKGCTLDKSIVPSYGCEFVVFTWLLCFLV